MSEKTNLEAVVQAPTGRQAIIGAAVAFSGLALGSRNAWAQSGEEISHTCAAIHQEVVFKASRKRVYEALTETKQFDEVVQLSEAMKGGMPPGAAPTNISREAGDAFNSTRAKRTAGAGPQPRRRARVQCPRGPACLPQTAAQAA